MLRHALRRLLWTLPTLIGVSLLSFLVLSFVPDPTEDALVAAEVSGRELARLRRERFLDLPRFVNVSPRDVRARALDAVAAIAAGGDGAAAAAVELRRLGGAALPHVLPALDELAPEPRTQVALALAPVAARMRLPKAEDAAERARAVAFWARFWDDRGIEFRAASVRSAVRRVVRYGSASRAADLRELDTFALDQVLGALVPPRDAATFTQARALVDLAADVTEIDDRIAPGDDLPAARACVARWRAFWNVYRGDFDVFSGPTRLAAMLLETRYGKWALGAVTRRLGVAATGEPVLDELSSRAPVTLTLVFGAIALAYALAIPLGALSAASRGHKSDLAIASAVLVFAILPTAVVAVLAARVAFGSGSLVLPTCVLALSIVASPTRHQRSALVAVLSQDFVRAARARGAGRTRTLVVHGLRNALLPVATLAAIEPPMALGGAFVVERVFDLHGIGELTILAVQARDVSWLMAISIFAAAIAALCVIATDLAYVLIDPRIADVVLSREGAPVTHARAIRGRVLRSKRMAIGVVLLGSLGMLAIFAELFAAPAPIARFGPGGVEILPALTDAAALEPLTEAELAARYEGSVSVWPLVRYGPTQRTGDGPSAPSSRRHPLGTDVEGRDLAARLVYGARTALGVSLSAVLVGALLGVVLGGLAGTLRGFWNDRLVRLVETVDTFPSIIVVALVRAIEREPSAISLVIAVACVRWAEIARLVRAEVLSASSEEYVLAARALGSTKLRVFYRHILPNALGPVIVSSVFGVASVVLLEAAISFLAMGAPTTAASWGETLAQAARHPGELRLLLLPGGLLLMTVGGSYLIADALRDAIDARTARIRSPRAP